MILKESIQLGPNNAYVIDLGDRIVIGGRIYNRDLVLCDSRWFDPTVTEAGLTSNGYDGNTQVPTRYGITMPMILTDQARLGLNTTQMSAASLVDQMFTKPMVLKLPSGPWVKWNAKLSKVDIDLRDTQFASAEANPGMWFMDATNNRILLSRKTSSPATWSHPYNGATPTGNYATLDAKYSVVGITNKATKFARGNPLILQEGAATRTFGSPQAAGNTYMTDAVETSDGQRLIGVTKAGTLYSCKLVSGTYSTALANSLSQTNAAYSNYFPVIAQRADGKDVITIFPYDCYTQTGTPIAADAYSRVQSFLYDPANPDTLTPITSEVLPQLSGVLIRNNGKIVYAFHWNGFVKYEWDGTKMAKVSSFDIQVATYGANDRYMFLIDTQNRLYVYEFENLPLVSLNWAASSVAAGATTTLSANVSLGGQPVSRIVRLRLSNAQFENGSSVVDATVDGTTSFPVTVQGGNVTVEVLEVK